MRFIKITFALLIFSYYANIAIAENLTRKDLQKIISNVNESEQSLEKHGLPPSDCENCNEIQECKSYVKGKRVLYIGDSHSYLHKSHGTRMGNLVYSKIKACGASDIRYEAFCGSRPADYTAKRTPKTSCGHSTFSNQNFKTSKTGAGIGLKALSAESKAEHVVINLGDNMFSGKKENGKTKLYLSSRDKASEEIKALLNDLTTDQKCTWIGPVYHSPGKYYSKANREVDKLYSVLKESIQSRCRLIDSRNYFTTTHPNDGLHLTNEESEIWGIHLANDI